MDTCDNCDTVSESWYLQGGKRFCKVECARAFFDSRKESHISNIGTETLTAQEVRTEEQAESELLDSLERRIAENVPSPDLILQMTHSALIERLAQYKREYQRLRTRERATHARINKLLAIGEAEKTDRYRKLGVNSDLEAKNKVHSVLQRSILQYRKMGLSDEKIKKMMILEMEVEESKVDLAFKEL